MGIRQTYQWNRIENPEMSLHNYGQLNFDKGTKTATGKEYFSTKAARTTRYPHAKE